MITTMRLDPVNAVSSFHYYMWNAWGEEECKITFGCAYKHFSHMAGHEYRSRYQRVISSV